MEPHAYTVWVFILTSFRTLLIHVLPWKSVYNIFNFPLADLLYQPSQNDLKCCKYFGFPCTFAPWQYVMQVTVNAALRPLLPYTVVTCFFRKTEARCFSTLAFLALCTLAHEWMKTMHEYKFLLLVTLTHYFWILLVFHYWGEFSVISLADWFDLFLKTL